MTSAQNSHAITDDEINSEKNKYVKKPHKLAAFCGSYLCAGRKANYSNAKAPVPKVVSKNELWCPDCKNALVWRKVYGVVKREGEK